MPIIQWKANYETHIPEVDKQHQKLVELINTLYDSMKAGQSTEKCYVILEELVNYTDYHFKTEERLFEKVNYPEKDRHRKLHDELRVQAVDHLKHYKEKPLVNSIEVMHFLTEWLNQHILSEDLKLGKFVNQGK